ncbi:hypothetical protein RFI_16313 [Reticulomyxa filosa]|uniref:Uncharacterized protein n=1 Tax=Reticulomyxa filosa TaxID=46433 RepID=X6N4I3_RETFI|nr:hypothetical protein RFI_16313 [Reticulomyxa filosa]|eukprot:ETO20896.1 hypothetical protein RFI_16313 [Reticulomyxa filosa]
MLDDLFIKEKLLSAVELLEQIHLGGTLTQYKAKVALKTQTLDVIVEIFNPWNGTNEDKDEENSKEKQEAKATFSKHYLKYKSGNAQVVVRETMEMYLKITKPYIDAMPEKDVKWMDDILNGKSENSRVICRDSDAFVSLVAKTWHTHVNCEQYTDQSQWKELMSTQNILDNLHIIAIIGDKTLRSVRDLQLQKHIVLLNEIKRQTLSAIAKIYNVPSHFLLVFVHYLPHKKNISVTKAILLDDIIDHLQMDLEFYQKCSITCRVKKHHPLCAHLQHSIST